MNLTQKIQKIKLAELLYRYLVDRASREIHRDELSSEKQKVEELSAQLEKLLWDIETGGEPPFYKRENVEMTIFL